MRTGGDWRRALRMATGITAALMLVGIYLSARLDRFTDADLPAAGGIFTQPAAQSIASANFGIYLEHLFYAVLVIGLATAVYIATRSGES